MELDEDEVYANERRGEWSYRIANRITGHAWLVTILTTKTGVEGAVRESYYWRMRREDLMGLHGPGSPPGQSYPDRSSALEAAKVVIRTEESPMTEAW